MFELRGNIGSYLGGKMKRYLVSFMGLVCMSISLSAVTGFHIHDTEPRFRITYEVINPKFVPDNFSCSTFDELKNHHFQIPETLLKELTNEELVRYIFSTTEFMMSAFFSVANHDFSGFNGYMELISRPNWADDVINLPGKFLNERDDVMLLHSFRFSTMYDVYTKMTLQQQQQILRNLNGILSLRKTANGEEYEIDGSVMQDLRYWAGVVLQNYYPSEVGQIVTIRRGAFSDDVDDSISLVHSELLKAINSGKHIQVGFEHNR